MLLLSVQLRASSSKDMTLDPPFLMNFYYGGKVNFLNGEIKGDKSTSSFTVPATHEMGYEEFEKLIYEHSGIDGRLFTLKNTLYFQYCGKSKSSPIMSEEELKLMFFLAKKDPSFSAQVHVERVEIPFYELAELWTLDEIRGFYLENYP